MKVINVSLSALLLAAEIWRSVEGFLMCVCVCSVPHCVTVAPQTYEKLSLSLSLSCCQDDITLPFDPHRQESADWMIGLWRTSTLTPNSILLMSGAIRTDDAHTRPIGRHGLCVCVCV